MDAQVSFVCNICDRAQLVARAGLGREAPTCACGSSVRTRAIVHLLSLGLFGRSLALRDFPHDKRTRGIGLSDWRGYAAALADRLDYTNTFLHKAPTLDVTQVPASMDATADFVIAADVFQNVADPVQRAFDGVRRLLRPGGLLILTAPYDPAAATVEHFPGPGQFELREVDGARRLYQRSPDGGVVVHERLVFHGGEGFTVEMRRFGLRSLLAHCEAAGLVGARVAADAVPERGIVWDPWSTPVVARAPA